jgi:hypothetical protein
MGEQGLIAEGHAGSGELDLVGQWRARLDFEDGDFAAVGDLEFMYVFNAGGTLTESSNYDAAPPVPPAYGIWRRTGPDRFEAKYEFYPTKPPGGLDELTSGGGWLVAGRGVFTETMTVAAGGDTFTSTILYEAFDAAGNPVAGGGTAVGRGVRLRF